MCDCTTIMPILLIVVLPAILLLQYHSAIEARGRYAEEVDEYLGDESNPKELKILIYHMFDSCLSHFLPTKALFFYLFFSGTDSTKHSLKALKEKFGEDKVDEAVSLSVRLLSINMRLSPIQHFMYVVLTSFMAIIRVVFTIPSKGIESSLLKTESSWYKAIH